MRIQHNIMAMNAYRNYNNNTSALSKNLERLSSGYKINRAGDDAAGLAISEKMRAQITGLTAAQKNVKDGISLVNTAEGAMQEIQDMLNRMVSLATQSANGTYDDDVDRANLQKEVESLKEEINRIADSANFNGIKLLDGSLDARTYDVTTGTGGDIIADGSKLILQHEENPTEGVGEGTIYKKTPLTQEKTSFELDLQNLSVQGAKEGDTLKVTIGNQSVTLKAEDSPSQTGWDGDATGSTYIVKTSDLGDTDAIATAIMNAFNTLSKTVPGETEPQKGLHINGEKFNAAKENGDNRVTFTQVGTEKTVNPNLDVKIEYSPVGGGASASVANVNAGSTTTPASFSVDLTLPATGTTDMCMFGQYFRVTDGAASQSLDGIAGHALGSTSGSGTESDPYVITRNDTTTDAEILGFIAQKLSTVTVGDKTFNVSVGGDGMSLSFRATENGTVTADNETLDSAGLAEAVNAQVTVSSGSSTSTPSTPSTPDTPDTPGTDPSNPGTTTPSNPLGTVSATAGTAGAATKATSTIDLADIFSGLSASDLPNGSVTVGSKVYNWGSDSTSGATTITLGGSATLDDLKTALKTQIKNDADTEQSGTFGTSEWGTGDDADKLIVTASTAGSTPSAPGTVLGVTAATVAGTDAGTPTAGRATADLDTTSGLDGGTLVIGDKTFFFSKYADSAAAAAGNDETAPVGATVLYTGDYSSAASLASALNNASNAPTDVDVAVTQATGKVNIAVTEKSGSEGVLTESQLQGKISFTPKATSSSGGGTESEGIEIVRMSIAGHEETASGTPSAIGGTANNAISVGGTPAVAAKFTTNITHSTALAVGNTITIGSDTYTVVADSTANPGASDVLEGQVNDAAKFGAFVASKATPPTGYTLSADASGNLVYTAETPGAINGEGPSSSPTAITVSVAVGSGSSTPSISFAAIGGSADSGTGTDAVAGSKTLNASTLDSTAIKTAADAVSGITSGNVQIEMNASNKLELKIGGNVIGTSDETVDNSATTFTFKTSDGTALGTATASAAPATSDFTAALDTGLTYTAATTGTDTPGTDPVTPGGGDDTNPPSSGGDTTTVSSTKLAVSTVDFFDDNTALTDAAVKAIKEAFEDIGSNGKILVNQDVEVDLSGITISAGAKGKDVARAIANAAKAAAETWNAANSSTLGYKYTNIRVSTSQAGTANDIAGQTAGEGIYILMDQQSVPTEDNISKLIGTYNVNTTQNLQGAGKDNEVLASTIITENAMKDFVADGNILTIGNKSYVFKTAGDDSVVKKENGDIAENGDLVTVNGKEVKVIDVSDAAAADQTKKAMEILGSKGFANNKEFTIGYEQYPADSSSTNRLSIHETKGVLANDDPMSEKLKTKEGFNSLITVESYKELHTEKKEYNPDGKKLTLQIGDTSDKFNQLGVDIGDMHTTAMVSLKRDEDGNLLRDAGGNTIQDTENTIAAIDISSQEGAAKAINIIKDAINYVSSVRGDLGAISNRLDHTANNLSVMAENITDAESTIRDTDIAEEMMAYTKNNILVQSAQAMLAQANQVPQGVLQLLQ